MSSVRRRQVSAPIVAFALVAGCASTPGDVVEGAAAPRLATEEEKAIARRADPLVKANFWAEEHAKDPANLDTTLEFVRALRGISSHERAVEIAYQATALHPDSAELWLLLGRSLSSEGNFDNAANALQRAAALDTTNATPLAALGLALDKAGRHLSAQDAYRAALNRDPNRIATRANYGLSLALSGDLPGAEQQLQEAAASPRATVQVRQNLALVLGLQGKFDEMREIAAVDAPPELLAQNAEVLRAMIGSARSWERLAPFSANDTIEPDSAEPSPDAETPADTEAGLRLRGALPSGG